jgi:hypothetical protein
VNTELAARQAAAITVLTDYTAFRAAGAVSDGAGLAWQYWADHLAVVLQSLIEVIDDIPAVGTAVAVAEIRAVFDTFD